MSRIIKVFAPHTVANVGCGYDVLGFALCDYGDTITLSARNDDQLVITDIRGADLPLHPKENVATVAMDAMRNAMDCHAGFDIKIEKNIVPGSGLGSSASSAAGAVFALNEWLNRPLSRRQLVRFAMEGERFSSGNAHADNVAPSLMGGFTVVRSYEPLDVFNIPYPDDLLVVIIFPEVKTRTADAKRILKPQVPLSSAVRQWGNVAGLVSGLMVGDYGRIGASLEDVIVTPVRKVLIPCFDEIVDKAMEIGALGTGISGSGPSTFALTHDREVADKICSACAAIYRGRGIDVISFVSAISPKGAVVI